MFSGLSHLSIVCVPVATFLIKEYISARLGPLPKVLAIYLMQFLETLVVLDRSLQLVVFSSFLCFEYSCFSNTTSDIVMVLSFLFFGTFH